MGKSKFFTGQPIFNQVLSFIPKRLVHQLAREQASDYYYKNFKTYDHLVTMLYATLNQCTSLREVTTGMLAWEHRIHHLGLKAHPRRSTIADANKHRSEAVFEQIYLKLVSRYSSFLPDSRSRSRKNNLYIFDSTSIALFQEILRGSGLVRRDGRSKGGIKVHTLLHAATDTPVMVRYSAAAASDMAFLKQVQLPRRSVIVFDRGYRDYTSYNRFNDQQITWVTRHRDSSVYKIKQRCPINEYQKSNGITADWHIELGHDHSPKAVKVQARMVNYKDSTTGKRYCFITNNFKLAPLTIAHYYRQRWQIEVFFKRIKQNYPLHYFLGDNENAIKIQIWCALIADLLLRVVKRGTRSKMAFSNLVGLIRLHLMTYIDLKSFLRRPEKSLVQKNITLSPGPRSPNLFAY